MKKTGWFLLILLLAACGNTTSEQSDETTASSPTNEIEMNNETPLVEIHGTAYNRKGGAVVEADSDQEHYWIDGLDSWEAEQHGKPVIVRGTLKERDDNPVFLDTGNPDEIVQGIPVETEEQLEAQKSRPWILEATFEFQEE